MVQNVHAVMAPNVMIIGAVIPWGARRDLGVDRLFEQTSSVINHPFPVTCGCGVDTKTGTFEN